jgi:N-acetylglutamate synthase-like GNAT family acetyltransferase
MARIARSGDFDEILVLYRQLQPSDPVLTDESDRQAFETILETEGMELYVLEQDGRIAATAYLNVIPNITRASSPYAVVENVVVDAELRGRGFGKVIMATALDEAWRRGCYKVMLMTGSRKSSTHGFYRACGFSADDKTRDVVHRT